MNVACIRLRLPDSSVAEDRVELASVVPVREEAVGDDFRFERVREEADDGLVVTVGSELWSGRAGRAFEGDAVFSEGEPSVENERGIVG